MRIITARRLRELANAHPDAANWLHAFADVVADAEWVSIVDVRKVYPHADAVTTDSGSVVTVFNVRGNNYRLIAAIHYRGQRFYVLRFLTHREYDRNAWRREL